MCLGNNLCIRGAFTTLGHLVCIPLYLEIWTRRDSVARLSERLMPDKDFGRMQYPRHHLRNFAAGYAIWLQTVYLEFDNLSPHQNANLGRHKKLIDYKLHVLFCPL